VGGGCKAYLVIASAENTIETFQEGVSNDEIEAQFRTNLFIEINNNLISLVFPTNPKKKKENSHH